MNWNKAKTYRKAESAALAVTLLGVVLGIVKYWIGQNPTASLSAAAIAMLGALYFQSEYYHKTGIQEDKI